VTGRRSAIRRLVSVALAAMLLPAGGGVAGAQAAQPVSQTDNLEHIRQVTFPPVPGRGASWNGTDSDFLEFQIPQSPRLSLFVPPRREWRGPSATMTATLADPETGAGLPGRSVLFFVDGDLVQEALTDAQGVARAPTSAGFDDETVIRAAFAGDDTHSSVSVEARYHPGRGINEVAEPGSDWTLPTTQENGGIVIPAGYQPQPGEVRSFNLMGSVSRGMFVTDITDPRDPVVVARWDCGISQADVFVFQQEASDGTTHQYAAYSQDATNGGIRASACFQDIAAQRGAPLPTSSRGTFIADVTDPYRPKTEDFLQMARGTHQTTVHPSGDYVYNSAAVVNTLTSGVVGFIEVYKVAGLADGEAPVLVDTIQLTTGLDSHDMTFNEDGTRLYSAALTHSFVINTEDPENNQIVSRIFDPAINIHHDAHAVTVATPVGERTYLLLGDELGGATSLGFCPGGGVHVYDITGPLELAPVKVGAFFIPEIRVTPVADVGGIRTCTAHVIQVLPEQELLVMAWYNGGVRILDYSGLAGLGPAGVSVGVGGSTLTPGIQEIAHSRFQNSQLWSAKVLEVADDGSFFIFGGDMTRTLDIWRFNPDGEVATDGGTWLDAERAAGLQPTTPAAGGYAPFCLLPPGD
jgi:hypothetical protein